MSPRARPSDGLSLLALGAAVLVVSGAFSLSSCRVEVPDNASYACKSDQDCGGDGYRCVAPPVGPALCCKPSGSEACDGLDNDCNGLVDDLAPPSCYTADTGTPGVGRCAAGMRVCGSGGVETCVGQVTPTPEVCNGLDDDCDGQADEIFDFQKDVFHCGNCQTVCESGQICINGTCSTPKELDCSNGTDDEGDQLIDCADPECEGQACGSGCVCVGGGKTEGACGDNQDNEGDGAVDCFDPDCNGQTCGTGCACKPGGGKSESGCGDNQDNDGDGSTDCLDSDCNNLSCGTGCTCSGGTKVESACGDNQDNDVDSSTDCADSDCNLKACGGGCVCRSGQKAETECFDLTDNDGDTLMDCKDTDCEGVSCGSGCVCTGGVRTETICSNGRDDDGNQGSDCADPDCLGKLCRSGTTRTCQSDGRCQ